MAACLSSRRVCVAARRVGLGLWVAGLVAAGSAVAAAELRTVLALDGTWEVGEGTLAQPPAAFDRRVPVPGLVDMATPPFAEVGVRSARREAFWYRRTFRLEGAVPAVATLKLHKAAYGAKAFINGALVGEHSLSFTPGLFDVRSVLRGDGAQNDLLVRVGAGREALPPGVPTGADFEKTRYIPGLFDSVELILSGTPHIVRVQVAPDVANRTARVQIVLRNAGPATATATLDLGVREAGSGRAAGTATVAPVSLAPGQEQTVEARVPIADCRLWSPEDPFLYELTARTATDELRTRFGMRQFRLDPASGRALLNGRPYFLRGSNVTLYRFLEDAQRGDKPWREEWVRRLHRQFRDMHWNSLRYCIGFPPELWYRIADEEGILIQDEYPIWHGNQWPKDLTREALVPAYREWLQERWNHPCAVIWDAQNESVTDETGAAIGAVREFDLSSRPWDNGWAPPQAPTDVYESHPYRSGNPHFRLADLARAGGVPGGNPVPNTNHNPIIINEYGWMWLNRDGTPTTLSREFYRNQLGADATPAARRLLYARYLAAKTEFWRAHRACAGVLHFCGLGYSRPDGQTSDHFADLEALTFDPDFHRYVRDAFAPVGLMLDVWAEEWPPGTAQEVPVVVINDLDREWQGQVRLRLLHGQTVVAETAKPAVVPAFGDTRLTFAVTVPGAAADYQLQAALLAPEAEAVCSWRDVAVLTPEQKRARDGIAVGQPVTASSNLNRDGATAPSAAVDGLRDTRWSSEFSDPQWLAVDLGRLQTVGRVELLWEAACGKAYTIEVSADGQTWREVYRTTDGKGGLETVRFAPTQAWWVRLHGTARGTQYGYSLWEFRVFPE